MQFQFSNSRGFRRIEAIFIIFFLFLSCPMLAQEETPQGITVESRHVVAEMVGKELLITDAILVNVHSLESGKTQLTFSVPVGYQDFQILNGLSPDSLSLEEDRIMSKKALVEGKIPTAFKYVFPVKQNTTTLSFQVYRDTQRFYFLMKNLELRIASEQLVDEGIIDMGERKYYALSAVGLKSGENFTITISGLGKRTRRKNVLILASIVVILLIIIAALLFTKGKPEDTASSTGDNVLKEKKKFLASMITMLDEKYQKGDIGKRAYRELRAEIKEKLDQIAEMEEELKIEDTQG